MSMFPRRVSQSTIQRQASDKISIAAGIAYIGVLEGKLALVFHSRSWCRNKVLKCRATDQELEQGDEPNVFSLWLEEGDFIK